MVIRMYKKTFIVIKKTFNFILLCLTQKIIEYSASKDKNSVVEILSSDHYRDPIPKIIWIYWHDQDLPDLVSFCVARIRKLNPEYNVVLLNKFTVCDFLPQVKSWHGGLSVQILSDLIRLNLIYKYGGVWVDASVIFFENMSWIDHLSLLNRYDLIGFYRSRLTANFNSPVVESWMLAAPPKNKFVKKWCEIFNPVSEKGLDDFYNKICERKDFAEIKQKINLPKYLAVYLAHQIAVKEYCKVNCYLRCVEHTGYFYQECYPQNYYVLSKVWCKIKRPSSLPPLIKLTRQNRDFISDCKKIESDSIIGYFLNS